jgi:hypothetical protein
MCHDVSRIEAEHDEVVEDFRHALGERATRSHWSWG